MIAGCGADLLINICLTLLGVFPGKDRSLSTRTETHPVADCATTGHIHAFYLEYVYYNKQEQARNGIYDNKPAPGVYSDNVQTGGRGYGTMGAT